ncbi:hypothetical protein [Paucibacter sp. KCTC 42545]|uniref:hypothetical protein n=1 Tax=Paucibacter sp. KCTC 42545 TaxID=1768242 RepID=UPI000A5CA3B4|nr:hypothetical protein [Paucibacter sp. KCTC 42545]
MQATDQKLSAVARVLLTSECGHVPLKLVKLNDPKPLWILTPPASNANAYANYADNIAALVSACSYVTADTIKSCVESQTCGVADRYGGAGIGKNGGSGRNAIVGGLQIKGVGRTPLVGASTRLAHASGGAYLEECVRETIYSLVVQHDFPYGAVPVRGIIDTGIDQLWPAGVVPAVERRVLLIRELFLRPAHFERAIGFESLNQFEGQEDAARVMKMIRCAEDLIGKNELIEVFDTLWRRWSHQLAYGFVHRLSHGNNTSSNISIDGRLVDFGAATALPSWERAATSYMPDPFNGRINAILTAMRSVYYYLARHLGVPEINDNFIADRQSACVADFMDYVSFETLRLAGVDNATAEAALRGQGSSDIRNLTNALISRAQQRSIDLFVPGRYDDSIWDFSSLWSERIPKHLTALAATVRSLVHECNWQKASEQCLRLTRSRPDLYKPNLRNDFFEAIKGQSSCALGVDEAFVRQFVSEKVSDNVIEDPTERAGKSARPVFRR